MNPRIPHTTEAMPRTIERLPSARPEEGLVALAVARAKEGDKSALHFVYERYADDVHRYVKSIVRDHHEAEDITHSVFVKLMSAIHSYEQRNVSFAAWLLRVARNAALDSLRARRTLPSEDIRTSDDGQEEVGFDRSQCLKHALESLPHEQREVLVLRHIVGLTPREIADRLHKTESSIHGLHHRGRGALKAALKELDAAPVTA